MIVKLQGRWKNYVKRPPNKLELSSARNANRKLRHTVPIVLFIMFISCSYVCFGQKQSQSALELKMKGKLDMKKSPEAQVIENLKVFSRRKQVEPKIKSTGNDPDDESDESEEKEIEETSRVSKVVNNNSTPTQNLFDTFTEDEEDDDEFYEQNPVELKNDFDVDQEIESISLNDSDFRDLKLESEPDTYNSSFKAPIIRHSSKKKRIYDNKTDHEPEESNLAHDCALILKRGECVTFGAVESALSQARRRLRFRRPRDLNSIEPEEASINSVGELTEMATRILADRLALDWEDISLGLEQLDTRQTSLWPVCPALFSRPPNCPAFSRYRTHTGQCNNPISGHIGASNMPFVRILPPDYADGVGTPRRSSVSGRELPPARLLALTLHPDFEILSGRHSALYMAWGQLLNHDLSLASGARPATGHQAPCCGRSNSTRSSVCLPIEIPEGDPVYGQYGIRCHEFKRSLAGLRPGCSLGPRTQFNLVSSFVDASFVYGSSRSASLSLRRNSRGLLEMWNYFESGSWLPLLPPQLEQPDEECVGRAAGRYCFRSGDPRTNQQAQLVALHTVHARQHNRLAGALSRLNPHWTDRRLYHEARHIHIAIVQHILLAEYLPALLGPKLCKKFGLVEAPAGSYWDHYEPELNAGISQAFSAAAFRQGHTTVPSQVYRFNNRHLIERVYQLRQLFRQPWPLFEPGALDEFLLGALNAPATAFDPFISADLSGHLLETPEEPVGLDLTAINIQRGRDQGVPGYNAFRDWCGLGRANSFAELDGHMSNRSSQAMAAMYESVDDIDLFSAGISEFPLEGAQVGPTFACIIGRQFSALRRGDRYWFESSMGPHAFTIGQLDSIRQVSLARLMCANSDNLITIQQMALEMAHPVLNPRLFCTSLPDLDITLWLDPLRPDQANDQVPLFC